jgi:hypothetical protein
MFMNGGHKDRLEASKRVINLKLLSLVLFQLNGRSSDHQKRKHCTVRMSGTVHIACDSDTESATCHSSSDFRAWILLCVSCWNGKRDIKTGRGLYDHCCSYHSIKHW